MNLSIYETDESNAPRAFELMKMAFKPQRNFVEPEPSIFRGETIGSLSSAVARGEKRLVVALHRKRILGCVLCSPNSENPEEDYYFSRLSVNPRYQGTGIGSALLEDVESWAKSHKFKRITCHVQIALRQNVAMFESKGYDIYGEGIHDGFDQPTYYKMGKILS